jgi:hypothetical protein
MLPTRSQPRYQSEPGRCWHDRDEPAAFDLEPPLLAMNRPASVAARGQGRWRLGQGPQRLRDRRAVDRKDRMTGRRSDRRRRERES